MVLMVRPDRLKAILGGLLAGSLETDVKRRIVSERSKHINVKLDICLGVSWTPLQSYILCLALLGPGPGKVGLGVSPTPNPLHLDTLILCNCIYSAELRLLESNYKQVRL